MIAKTLKKQAFYSWFLKFEKRGLDEFVINQNILGTLKPF